MAAALRPTLLFSGRPFRRPPPSLSSALVRRRFGSNTNSPVSFPFSDSDSDSDEQAPPAKNPVDPSKLPPPYDPFSKKPVVQEPDDPTDLQQVFHELRSGDGLMSSAVKMFDGLSKDGRTHEALALFSQLKDSGSMPDVVAHTAVIEAYAAAGRSKEAMKSYMRMLSCGVKPNAYTYGVLIKGLARDGKVGDARKYLLEMMGAGMRPNAGTYTAVFEAYVKGEKVEEGKELVEEMKRRGFVPDEKAVREQLDKRGPVFRGVIGMLFDK